MTASINVSVFWCCWVCSTWCSTHELIPSCLFLMLSFTVLCSEVVRRKAPRHILWWSNLYKLKPQIVLLCMCVVTAYLCTNTKKQTGCTQWLKLLLTTAHRMCLGVFPCDNLNAKCCSIEWLCLGAHCSIEWLCLGAHALKAYGSQFVCVSVCL